jgi:Ca2+-binding RTX toxin-like protein
VVIFDANAGLVQDVTPGRENTGAFYLGENVADSIAGRNGNDFLDGRGGDDTLYGGSGDDLLDGGTGNNTLLGGAGNDTYIVRNVGDVVTEDFNAGTDTVTTALAAYHLGANVEKLTHIGSATFTGIGNELNNVIIGGTGNDYLIGLDGNDTLIDGSGLNTLQGGKGNDIYAVQSNADTVFEFANEGTDQVQTFLASYQLSANIENLTFVGSGNHTGVGNEINIDIIGGTGNDYLIGLDGNDTLIDGSGGNTLQGGTGDDIYAVQSNADTVFEFANEGTDQVQTFLASYTLSPNVEQLIFIGNTNHTGVGNAIGNTFIGGTGTETWTGAGGNDIYNFRTPGNGLDIVNDFNADNANAAEHDHMDLVGRGLTFASLAVTTVSGGVVVGIPGGDAVFLLGVTAGAVDANDFFFV